MRRYFPLVIVVLCLMITACNGNLPAYPTPTTAPTIVEPTQTTAVIPSPTAENSKVVLLVPGGDASVLPENAKTLRDTLAELVAGTGMEVEVQTSLAAADISPAVKVVVALPSPDEQLSLEDLARKVPAAQFLAVGIPGLQAGGNLSVISGDQVPQVAYLAGYIAAIVTPDWRVGVVTLPDTTGQSVRDAFLNGARYLCGICNPKYPPYPGYPAFAEATSKTDWQAAIDSLKSEGVKTVFVDPQLTSPELLDALVKAGMQIVGYGPVPELMKPRWVAGIQLDAADGVKKVWPEVIAGKGGQTAAMNLVVEVAQEDVLTVGKMRLVEQVARDLAAGYLQ